MSLDISSSGQTQGTAAVARRCVEGCCVQVNPGRVYNSAPSNILESKPSICPGDIRRETGDIRRGTEDIRRGTDRISPEILLTNLSKHFKISKQ